MTSKKPKGAVKFHQDWEVKYAVQVCTRDPVSKDVCSVVCLMCTNFGREDDAEAAERKRKRTSNDKYYTAPWRTDNFVSHLRKQHAVMEEYRKLAPAEKVHFFAVTESPERVNLRSFVQPEASLKAQIIAKQKCSFVIDGDIVSKLILELLLTPTIEEDKMCWMKVQHPHHPTRPYCLKKKVTVVVTMSLPTLNFMQRWKRILKMFVYTAEDDVYTVKVKSVLKLNMVASFVEIGVSFRQARRIYQAVKEQTGMGHLGSVSDGEVAQLCRIVCAINLQYLKELFKKVWAFSIGLDAGNNAGSSYLDIRMRCLFKGDIQNLHLLAIPMRERHTGEYQANLVVSLLDVLALNWRHQLIGIATDGASTMTGSIKGTCTRLSNECHSRVFRIWCGAHQLDLVMKRAFNRLCNEKFLDTLTSVTGHLRRQQNLIADMKSTCPMFVTTRWLSMGKLLKWLIDKRLRLLQHFNEKKPACTPSIDWWIVVAVIYPLVQRVETTFVKIQGMNTLVCEQKSQLSRLVYDLQARTNVNGPMTAEDHARLFPPTVEEQALVSEFFFYNSYYVTRIKTAEAIEEAGMMVQTELDKLKEDGGIATGSPYHGVLKAVSTFALTIVEGVTKIVAEQGVVEDDDAARRVVDEIPPVLPVDLCSMAPRAFSAILQNQRNRLLEKVSEEDIENIDAQFRRLRIVYREDEGMKLRLDANHSASKVQSFKDSWSPLGKDFDALKEFCGALLL
ncbi:hypothetical protein MHU86_22007 [Fragilaria crotonensis]|nr:hypothetical protein MHU86_22007 [Fragilaria crotonensis]